MSNAVILLNQPKLAVPAHIGEFFDTESNIAERLTVPSLGYEGKVWQISVDGEKTKLTRTNEEGDQEPLATMRVVVLDYAKRRGRTYYEGAYDPNKISMPSCASDDGITPNANITEPQSAKCDGCPMSVKGSKITPTGSPTTACSQHRMLAVIPANNLEFTPLRMKIAITSDYDKQSPELEQQGWFAFSNYTDMLRSKGVQHTAALVTKMKFDPNAAYPKVMFSPDRWLEPKELAVVTAVVKSEAVQKLVTPHHADTVNQLASAVAKSVAGAKAPTPAAKPAVALMSDDDDAPAAKPVATKAAPKAAAKAAPAKPAAKPVEKAPQAEAVIQTEVSDDVAALLAEWGED